MKTVVLLEDEEVLGRIYRKKLESSGYIVHWYTSVEDIEQNLSTLHPDVVLLDHGIKGRDKAGIDVIPLIRENSPHAKIIMLSNYSHADLQKEAFSRGADLYLIKINTDPAKLVQHIDQLSAELTA